MIILEKPKGRQRVEITHDIEDDWFVYIDFIEKTSNKRVERNMIVRKELDVWLKYLENNGWKIIKKD